MIVLDTNQLRHAAFPHGAVLGMLRKIAEISGMTLALPEMVVIEHVAHHRHEIEVSLTSARKALAALRAVPQLLVAGETILVWLV
ncbi:hypothetical protein OOK36_56050 [Streptomyces sp. NBC_00365]|uniref:hypothetical protein n=1 Tax=Streptomyces sp. NBC_00365 TaxID=2975726 RepID=UPI00225AFE71|nr:hypothetical protein [Streptomyces sp. NBC_00365]MCX5097769.1 hypothetical protein [Streptomyces sp. NBC_00365]